jgi:ribosomal protein L11 methyltransferase
MDERFHLVSILGKMDAMRKLTHRWIRHASARWEDAWVERLRFLGPQNVVIRRRPGSRVLTIEAYCDGDASRRLVGRFGGRAEAVPPFAARQPPRQAPLPVRGRLVVHTDEEAWRRACAAPSGPAAIHIPAGMAFGTGDHATTAACLRLLCDHLPAPGFTAADAGTGSGILAIACAALGAKTVHAFDNDPAAVKTARANTRLNRAHGVNIRKASAEVWTPPRPVDIVTANLFSGLLVTCAPRMGRWLRPGGILILSGILSDQWDAVRTAFAGHHGLVTLQVTGRGKWLAACLQKPARERRQSGLHQP